MKFSVTEQYTGSGRVDRDAGIIRGVKILGRESRNGRTYTDDAMKSAASVYEGMRVNTDHPQKQNIKSARSIRDWVGQLEGVTVKDDGVYGNLHLIKTHPYSNAIMECAERFPSKFGLSHNADCTGFNDRGRAVVESVTHVRSVDLVTNPATNVSLFESVGDTMDGMNDMGADSSNGVTQDYGAMVMAIVNNQDLTIDDKMVKIRKTLEQQAGNPAVETTEGYNGQQRSALPFRNSKELSALLGGRTPRGPEHSSSRSHSVLESSAGQQSALPFRNAKELSALLGSKRR